MFEREKSKIHKSIGALAHLGSNTASPAVILSRIFSTPFL